MMSCLSTPVTAPLTGPEDVEGLPESVKQVTWFITRQLFFVDLALPLQPDMEQVEDEDAMYAQLLKQPVDTDNRPTKPSSGSKIHAKQNVQVLNVESTSTSNINPDVVIEVEGTEEARQRGYVTIEIENPYPDLDVQIVVRTKKKLDSYS